MHTINVRALGRPVVTVDGVEISFPENTFHLPLLLLAVDTWMQPVKDGLSVEMILSLLWPLHTPRAGYTAFLEQTRRLREKLGNISELFDFSNHLYTLSSSIILQYDVAEYEAQFSIASDIIYDDVQVWTAAQRLYTGTFLSDWPTATLPRPFVEWMERRRQHLETHYQAIGYRINTFLK